MKTLLATTLSALLFMLPAFGGINIAVQPAPLTTVIDGSTVTLQVLAGSDAATPIPLTYQWYLGTTEVTGATSNKLVISNIQDGKKGNYVCTITEQTTPLFARDSNVAVVVVNTRPKILTQFGPAIAVQEDGTANFDVTMSGTSPFTSTWQKKVGRVYMNHSPANATVTEPTISSSRLSLSNIQLLADAGIYRVLVTNASGVVAVGKDLMLKVNTRPVILAPVPPATANPASSLNVTFGLSARLTVAVVGNAPFTYKWFKKGAGGSFVEIPRSNAASLTIKGTDSAADGLAEGPGEYKVEISNGFPVTAPATVSSGISTVRVIRKPKIAVQPIKPLIAFDNTVPAAMHTLSVTMDTTLGDPGTFSYQWQKDGKNIANAVLTAPNAEPRVISGATTASLNLNPIGWQDRGAYRVIIRNEVGTITSAAVPLTVTAPALIISQPPLNVFGAVGGSIKLPVLAGGTAPFTYQWFFKLAADPDFLPIPRGTASTLSLSRLSTEQIGFYKCKVTNLARLFPPGFSAETTPLFLQVDTPPTITQQTAVDGTDTTQSIIRLGSILHLVVNVSGTDRTAAAPPTPANPMTYQWQKNKVNLVGHTDRELNIPATILTDAGSYTCKISNFSGSVISRALTIKIQRPPAIVVQPTGATAIETLRLESTPVTVTGDPTLVYTWQRKTIGPGSVAVWVPPFVKQTTSKLIFTAVQLRDGGTYRCTISNSVDSVDTDEINMIVTPIPPPSVGPVTGLSIFEFHPTVARAGEKVRIYGSDLKFVRKVLFGTASATFVKESDQVILVTVPATAPIVATAMQLASTIPEKPETLTTTSGTFRRTTDYENGWEYYSNVVSGEFWPGSYFRDATILTASAAAKSVIGDNSGYLYTNFTLAGRTVYELNVPKRSRVKVTFANVPVITTLNGAAIYKRSLLMLAIRKQAPIANTSFTWAGPNGVVSYYISAEGYADDQSLLYSNTFEFETDADNQGVLLYAFVPYIDRILRYYGQFKITTQVTPFTTTRSYVKASDGNAIKGADVKKSKETVSRSAAAESQISEMEVIEPSLPIRFDGHSAHGSDAMVLWHHAADPDVGPGKVVASFTMSLQSGKVGGDDQFAWQIAGFEGEPLAALWFNAADGSIRAVEADGKTTTSIQHITPDGGAHFFEIVVDQVQGSWVTLMDGVQVVAPIPLRGNAAFGEISATWDLGADRVSNRASIEFDQFKVEAVVTP